MTKRSNTNKWGGRREGAGRPSSLDYFQKLAIGAAAERLAKRWADRRAHQRIRRRLEAFEYFELVAQAKAVPIEERKAWSQTCEGEYQSEDVEGAITSLAEHEGREPTRVISEPLSQVYGSRNKALRIVARWASWRYGTLVTLSRVDRCWKQYRKDFPRELE